MERILDKTRGMLKKILQMQKEIKQKTPVEKLIFPESDEEVSPSEVVQTVNISTKSVVRATITILAILLLAYFLYEIRGLLILFFISIFFASALEPFVDWMEKRHVPRSIGVILILLVFFGFFIVVIGSAVPIVVEQLTLIITNIVDYFGGLLNRLQAAEGVEFLPETVRNYIKNGFGSINIEFISKRLLDNFSNITAQIKDLVSGVGSTVGVVGAGLTSFTLSIADFFFSLILVFFLVFFLVVDKNNLHEFFQSLFPKKYGAYISTRIADV